MWEWGWECEWEWNDRSFDLFKFEFFVLKSTSSNNLESETEWVVDDEDERERKDCGNEVSKDDVDNEHVVAVNEAVGGDDCAIVVECSEETAKERDEEQESGGCCRIGDDSEGEDGDGVETCGEKASFGDSSFDWDAEEAEGKAEGDESRFKGEDIIEDDEDCAWKFNEDRGRVAGEVDVNWIEVENEEPETETVGLDFGDLLIPLLRVLDSFFKLFWFCLIGEDEGLLTLECKEVEDEWVE